MSARVRVGIKLSQQLHDIDTQREAWRMADAAGFDHIWLFDHLIAIHQDIPQPIFDGWTALGALAEITGRIRMGLNVTGNLYRHPGLLAKIATTVDHLSGGRLEMGLGAGWNEVEFRMFGLSFPGPAERIRRLDESCRVLKALWSEPRANFHGRFYQLTDAIAEPKPVQRPHPPLWSACGSDETARLTGSLGMGGLFGSEGGPGRVGELMALYQDALRNAGGPPRRAALMTAGYCHEDPQVAAERGSELVSWYIEQQRERARLVWRDYDPATVPPDYQGYYARDQRLAAGPHPGEPTPREVRDRGEQFCVGTPAECIRFIEMYEALGIEEMILLCAVGPATHEEVLNTMRLFGEQVIPHFRAKEKRVAAN